MSIGIILWFYFFNIIKGCFFGCVFLNYFVSFEVDVDFCIVYLDDDVVQMYKEMIEKQYVFFVNMQFCVVDRYVVIVKFVFV